MWSDEHLRVIIDMDAKRGEKEALIAHTFVEAEEKAFGVMTWRNERNCKPTWRTVLGRRFATNRDGEREVALMVRRLLRGKDGKDGKNGSLTWFIQRK